jgi:hypothetical protein
MKYMMQVKDMNRDELIELVAAVLLRFWSMTYLFKALASILLVFSFELTATLFFHPVAAGTGDNFHKMLLAPLSETLLDVILSGLLFFLAVPLARLVTSGLSPLLERKSAA